LSEDVTGTMTDERGRGSLGRERGIVLFRFLGMGCLSVQFDFRMYFVVGLVIARHDE
jgi:hypothetical protein